MGFSTQGISFPVLLGSIQHLFDRNIWIKFLGNISQHRSSLLSHVKTDVVFHVVVSNYFSFLVVISCL